MIGIYKITSPSGKIYIGQSTNINRRWQEHKRLSFKFETKLKNSLVKYGIDNHIFDIIEECEIGKLNDRESHWQDYYNSVHKGLNCFRTKSSDKSGYLCEESRKKISKSRKANPNVNDKLKGIPLSEEHKLKIGLGNKGKTKTEEAKQKISIHRKGKYKGEEHHQYGKPLNEKSRKAFSEIRKKSVGLDNLESKIVIDLNTGIFYYSIKEASFYMGVDRKRISGHRKNDTSLRIINKNNKIE